MGRDGRGGLLLIAECQELASQYVGGTGVGKASFSNHPSKRWIRQESSIYTKVNFDEEQDICVGLVRLPTNPVLVTRKRKKRKQ